MALCSAWFLTACYQPLPEQNPILPEAKMIDILTDVHLAEAEITRIRPDEGRDSLATFYYQQILAMHKVNPNDFDQSMEAYMQSPKAAQRIYTEVLSRLQEEQVKYGKRKDGRYQVDEE